MRNAMAILNAVSAVAKERCVEAPSKMTAHGT